jgi:Fe-S-cluster containining protein
MTIDFEPFFKQYEALVKAADDVFAQVKKEHPDCVTCEIACADCCHALFDLTLIEAMYINHHFNRLFDGRRREELLEKADEADRKVHKLKRQAYKANETGKPDGEILNEWAAERVRCPLLNAQDRCDMYDQRPITCRLYGIPTAIGGTGYTCGQSGFVPGKAYPTVNLDRIHGKLYEISEALRQALQSRYVQLATVLVPLSMALLTEYSPEYLGVPEKENPEAGKGENNE